MPVTHSLLLPADLHGAHLGKPGRRRPVSAAPV